MTQQQLFDRIVTHYEKSAKIVDEYQHASIHRGRQHSISSILEDLFAHFLQKELAKTFPKLNIYFMVDYGISIGNQLMIPDIAIIIDCDHPTLVSYLDIKTDLGYKRNYFSQFTDIKEKVINLRGSSFDGLVGHTYKQVKISAKLKWQTIVISDRNISKALLQENKNEAEKIKNYYGLYFLSGKTHPNRKQIDQVEIYENVFANLLEDIKTDVITALNNHIE